MQIIENIIPKSLQDEIETAIFSNNFPWGMFTETVDMYKQSALDSCVFDSKSIDSPQLVHVMASGSMLYSGQANIMSEYFFPLVQPLLFFMEDRTGHIYHSKESIHRVKANCLLQDINFPLDSYNPPHCDSTQVNAEGKTFTTLLYYVNDSDGDTFIFNECMNPPDWKKPETLTIKQRVTPKKGTAILFDSNRLHASSPPRNTKRRSVINIVLYK